jgi:hypothetical protein
MVEQINLSKDAIWKFVWVGDCLPKNKIFFWIFAYGKIVTAEKLKKR